MFLLNHLHHGGVSAEPRHLQSINQSIKQLTNRSTNLTINWTINQSITFYFCLIDHFLPFNTNLNTFYLILINPCIIYWSHSSFIIYWSLSSFITHCLLVFISRLWDMKCIVCFGYLVFFYKNRRYTCVSLKVLWMRSNSLVESKGHLNTLDKSDS